MHGAGSGGRLWGYLPTFSGAFGVWWQGGQGAKLCARLEPATTTWDSAGSPGGGDALGSSSAKTGVCLGAVVVRDQLCKLLNFNMVGPAGFEPATSSTRTRRSTKLSHGPKCKRLVCVASRPNPELTSLSGVHGAPRRFRTNALTMPAPEETASRSGFAPKLTRSVLSEGPETHRVTLPHPSRLTAGR
jgi:hypothetical protein